MPGWSKEAREHAVIARKIRVQLGEAAYLTYKKTHIVPPGLDAKKLLEGVKNAASTVLEAGHIGEHKTPTLAAPIKIPSIPHGYDEKHVPTFTHIPGINEHVSGAISAHLVNAIHTRNPGGNHSVVHAHFQSAKSIDDLSDKILPMMQTAASKDEKDHLTAALGIARESHLHPFTVAHAKEPDLPSLPGDPKKYFETPVKHPNDIQPDDLVLAKSGTQTLIYEPGNLPEVLEGPTSKEPYKVLSKNQNGIFLKVEDSNGEPHWLSFYSVKSTVHLPKTSPSTATDSGEGHDYHIKKTGATAGGILKLHGEEAYQEYKKFGKLPKGYVTKVPTVKAHQLPPEHPHYKKAASSKPDDAFKSEANNPFKFPTEDLPVKSPFMEGHEAQDGPVYGVETAPNVHMSGSHYDALDQYGHFGSDLNDYLRTGNVPGDPSKKAILADLAAKLDKSFEGSNVSKAGLIYRGIPADIAPQMHSGDVITDPAYISGAPSAADAKHFAKGGVLMEIHVPEGSKALEVGGLGNDIGEILLPRNSSLQIGEIYKGPDGITRVTADLVDTTDFDKIAQQITGDNQSEGFNPPDDLNLVPSPNFGDASLNEQYDNIVKMGLYQAAIQIKNSSYYYADDPSAKLGNALKKWRDAKMKALGKGYTGPDGREYHDDGTLKMFTKQFNQQTYVNLKHYDAELGEKYKLRNEIPPNLIGSGLTLGSVVDSNGNEVSPVPSKPNDPKSPHYWPDGAPANYSAVRTRANSIRIKKHYGEQAYLNYKATGLYPYGYTGHYADDKSNFFDHPQIPVKKAADPNAPKKPKGPPKAHWAAREKLDPKVHSAVRRYVANAARTLDEDSPKKFDLYSFAEDNDAYAIAKHLGEIYRDRDFKTNDTYRYRRSIANAIDRLFLDIPEDPNRDTSNIVPKYPGLEDADHAELNKKLSTLIDAIPDNKKGFFKNKLEAELLKAADLNEFSPYYIKHISDDDAFVKASQEFQDTKFKIENRAKIKDFLDNGHIGNIEFPRDGIYIHDKFHNRHVVLSKEEAFDAVQKIRDAIKNGPNTEDRASHWLNEVQKQGHTNHVHRFNSLLTTASKGASPDELNAINDLLDTVRSRVKDTNKVPEVTFPHYTSVSKESTDKITDLLRKAGEASLHTDPSAPALYKKIDNLGGLKPALNNVNELLKNASTPGEQTFLTEARAEIKKAYEAAVEKGYLDYELLIHDPKNPFHPPSAEARAKAALDRIADFTYIPDKAEARQFDESIAGDTKKAIKTLQQHSQAIENKKDISLQISERLKDNPDFQHMLDFYEKDFTGRGNWHPEDRHRNFVANLISQWAGSSTGTGFAPNAIQRAAAEEFGINIKSGLDKAQGWDRTNDFWRDDKAVRGLRAFVRAQYDNTQEVFAKAGVTHVWGWRGFRFTKADNPFKEGFNLYEDPHMNPLSSFSFRIDISRRFTNHSGAMMAAAVPVNRILGTYRTGFGCTGEHEFVFIASDDDHVWVQSHSQADTISEATYYERIRKALEDQIEAEQALNFENVDFGT